MIRGLLVATILAGCGGNPATAADSQSVQPSASFDVKADCQERGGRYLPATNSCIGERDPGESTEASAVPLPTEEPTPEPTPTERPTPTATPEPETQVAAVGETVAITCGGTDCLRITATEPSFAQLYPDPEGFYADEPQITGNVFMQVFVEYEAISSAANYNPFDWAVFADGRAVDSYAFTTNGPKPELNSGQLPAGRSASGWLVYEVPAAGEIILAYAPNFEGPPVFEVTVRE